MNIVGHAARACRPSPRPIFLARPKHGPARRLVGPRWPGLEEQAVSRPYPRHVGQHGTARYRPKACWRPGLLVCRRPADRSRLPRAAPRSQFPPSHPQFPSPSPRSPETANPNSLPLSLPAQQRCQRPSPSLPTAALSRGPCSGPPRWSSRGPCSGALLL